MTGTYDHVPADGESIVSAHKTRASWQLRKDNVAVYAIQGRRPRMEDRFNTVPELEHTNTSIYGVFDGHGGEFAAEFTETTLFKLLMVRLLKAELAGEQPNLSELLTQEILHVDQQLLDIEEATGEISGTTALVALLRGDQLYVANVGDSRGVMCDNDGNALPLSFDHKPQQARERQRIKKAGGFISFNGVWRVAGILATSRALGDYPLKARNLVIAVPDVLIFDLASIRPRFMIIASDGLWDVFSNDEAISYIKDHLHEPHYGAKSLVLHAYYRGSLDNVTVMVVNFEQRRTTLVSTIDSASEHVAEFQTDIISTVTPLSDVGSSVHEDKVLCGNEEVPKIANNSRANILHTDREFTAPCEAVNKGILLEVDDAAALSCNVYKPQNVGESQPSAGENEAIEFNACSADVKSDNSQDKGLWLGDVIVVGSSAESNSTSGDGVETAAQDRTSLPPVETSTHGPVTRVQFGLSFGDDDDVEVADGEHQDDAVDVPVFCDEARLHFGDGDNKSTQYCVQSCSIETSSEQEMQSTYQPHSNVPLEDEALSAATCELTESTATE